MHCSTSSKHNHLTFYGLWLMKHGFIRTYDDFIKEKRELSRMTIAQMMEEIRKRKHELESQIRDRVEEDNPEGISQIMRGN